MMTYYILGAVLAFLAVQLTLADALADDKPAVFDPEKDLISLHYDHAPDKDDGHSAAADRSMLQTKFGKQWLTRHVLPVSGAYGTNARSFNKKSDAVMDACWNDVGGWLAAHGDRDKALKAMVERWTQTLKAGGDIWVKEGGQSDLTVDVVKQLKQDLPDIDFKQRVHVVQHSNWNEKKTTKAALKYAKAETHYIRIRDANRFLNKKGGDKAFEEAALKNKDFGKMWAAAFKYYKPSHRLDFSDTGELMHILGLGEQSIDTFRKEYLEPKRKPDSDQ